VGALKDDTAGRRPGDRAAMVEAVAPIAGPGLAALGHCLAQLRN
jgi:hypothetical protein